MDGDEVPVRAVAGGRGRADEPGRARVVAQLERAGRQPGPSGSPAFSSSEVTLAGMSTTTQCQKPDMVGASGSYTVMA